MSRRSKRPMLMLVVVAGVIRAACWQGSGRVAVGDSTGGDSRQRTSSGPDGILLPDAATAVSRQLRQASRSSGRTRFVGIRVQGFGAGGPVSRRHAGWAGGPRGHAGAVHRTMADRVGVPRRPGHCFLWRIAFCARQRVECGGGPRIPAPNATIRANSRLTVSMRRPIVAERHSGAMHLINQHDEADNCWRDASADVGSMKR